MKKDLFVQTIYGSHLITVEPDERSGYVAIAPALPGVITWGESVAHAKEMAKEAIELCIESLVQRGSGIKKNTLVKRSQKVLVRA